MRLPPDRLFGQPPPGSCQVSRSGRSWSASLGPSCPGRTGARAWRRRAPGLRSSTPPRRCPGGRTASAPRPGRRQSAGRRGACPARAAGRRSAPRSAAPAGPGFLPASCSVPRSPARPGTAARCGAAAEPGRRCPAADGWNRTVTSVAVTGMQLAGPDYDRYARPPPRVGHQPDGDEGFCRRAGILHPRHRGSPRTGRAPCARPIAR